MKTDWWITTDTHFGHENMVQLCGRPEDFTERIISDWKRKVKPEDWVIHLGDVSWPAYYDKLAELPGHKILVRGNHDVKSYTWYQKHGFDVVCENFTMKLEGMTVIFSHEPLVFHGADINIHGHLHAQAAFNSVCPAYSLALEEFGYRVIPLEEILTLAKALLTKHNMQGGKNL